MRLRKPKGIFAVCVCPLLVCVYVCGVVVVGRVKSAPAGVFRVSSVLLLLYGRLLWVRDVFSATRTVSNRWS